MQYLFYALTISKYLFYLCLVLLRGFFISPVLISNIYGLNFGLGYKTKTYNFPICYPLLKFIWTQNLLIIKWAKATSHAALVWVNILIADAYHLCSNMLLSGDDSYHLTWLIYEDAISFAPDVWDRASMIVNIHYIRGWDYLMEFGLQIGRSGSNPKNLGWVKAEAF